MASEGLDGPLHEGAAAEHDAGLGPSQPPAGTAREDDPAEGQHRRLGGALTR